MYIITPLINYIRYIRNKNIIPSKFINNKKNESFTIYENHG